MKTAIIILGLTGLLGQISLAQTIDRHLQTLDGSFSLAERKAATDSLLERGAAVFIQYNAPLLRVTVQSEPIGVASLCLATAERLRVLHASAALGMLDYHGEGDTWMSEEAFVWAMRDTAMTEAAVAARRAHLETHGWVATTYHMGNAGETEFLIRRDLWPQETLYLSLGIMPLARPMEIIGLPSAGASECARGDLVRGPPPLSGLRFDPASWKQVMHDF